VGELDELLALLTKLALRIENIVQAATCGVSAV
jgi:hypothetical protein